VQVTNSLGCSGSDTINIGQSQLVSVNLPPTAQGCGQATLNATSPGAASYLWSNGATTPTQTVQASGTYQVQVMDAQGCFDIGSIVVTIGQPITAAFWAPDTVVVGTPVQFVDGSAPLANTWQWDFGNGASASGTGTPLHTYATPGSYTVTLAVTNAGGCASDATRQVVVVEPTVSTADAQSLAANTTIYPNPSAGRFNLRTAFAAPTQGNLYVLDATGRQVHRSAFSATDALETTLDLAAFGAGVYQLVLETPAGRATAKLVVLK
jgi:PKD repeat protein